jgi:ABC-2 type transport system permease protein
MSADVSRLDAIRRARRAERAPSGGWRTIAAKEFADHVLSIRFFVLLLIVGIASVIPLFFLTGVVSENAAVLSGRPALLLALFTTPADDAAGLVAASFVAFFIPLIGIAFGFDAVNSERSQGTLSRLLAQPVHRDDVINGKFVAGLAVIGLMLAVLVTLTTSFAIWRVGITPSLDEIIRLVLWVGLTILYAGFWLAFALLLSVALRSAASAALVGFGTWLGLFLFAQLLLPIIAGFLFPTESATTAEGFYGAANAQTLLLRLSPATLYNDAMAGILNPQALAQVLGPSSEIQRASAAWVSGSEQFLGRPSMLTLDQSLLVVWPQIVILVAITVLMFAIAYVLFLRQEVRA